MRRLLVVMFLSTMCGCHSCAKESERAPPEAEPSAKSVHRLNERQVGLHPKLHTAPLGRRILGANDAGVADAEAADASP